MADTLLPKIKAIGAVNQEIIGRIISKKDQQIASNTYHINNKMFDFQFTVYETKESKQGSVIVDEWKKMVTLKIPIDLFKDHVDYKCETFADVQRLNASLLTVIEQYHFLDPIRAQPELQKFKSNFEVLQTCLGEVEGLLIEPESKLEEFEMELEEINKRIVKVGKKKGAVFGIQESPLWAIGNGTAANEGWRVPDLSMVSKHWQVFRQIATSEGIPVLGTFTQTNPLLHFLNADGVMCYFFASNDLACISNIESNAALSPSRRLRFGVHSSTTPFPLTPPVKPTPRKAMEGFLVLLYR